MSVTNLYDMTKTRTLPSPQFLIEKKIRIKAASKCYLFKGNTI